MRNEKNELKRRMQVMVDEANGLRNEASKKMYNVPKEYKLYAVDRITKFICDSLVCLVIIIANMIAVALNASDLFSVPPVVVLAVSWVSSGTLVYGAVKLCKVKNHAYVPGEQMSYFYTDKRGYGELVDEIGRLKAGIADYDRQYVEREEYIKKFEQYTWPTLDRQIGIVGLDIVLKAYDFHATLTLCTVEEVINLRLSFNEADYAQMDTLVKRFGRKVEESGQTLSGILQECGVNAASAKI